MIRQRFDRSLMAYSTQQSGARRRAVTQPRTQSTRPGTLNVCVGVVSLRPSRRMPRATPAFEARLKPPPAQRHSFRLAAPARRRRRFRSAAVTDSTLSTCCP